MSYENLLPNAKQFKKMIDTIAIQSGTKQPDDFAGSPGSEHIVAGDKNIGFYGFVKTEEFGTIDSTGKPFDGGNLAEAIGLTEGDVLFNNPQWLKFSYRGKVQFVPMRPLRYGVSWDDIYNVGAVYGTNTNGYLPPSGRAGSHLRMDASDRSLNTTGEDNFLVNFPGETDEGHLAKVGDTIRIEGFKNSSNNGDFKVVSISSTKIVLDKSVVTEIGNHGTRVYKPEKAVNQNAQIKIGGFNYKVRLLGGSLGEPRTTSIGDKDTNDSEWNNLMLPITLKALRENWGHKGYAQNVPNFGIGLTDIDLHTDIRVVPQLGSYSWTANSTRDSSYRRVVRGNDGVEYASEHRSWLKNNSLGWRPVLELIENSHSGYVSLY